jgi:hypothetical protein
MGEASFPCGFGLLPLLVKMRGELLHFPSWRLFASRIIDPGKEVIEVLRFENGAQF